MGAAWERHAMCESAFNDSLSARISEAATGRVFVKSDIANVYENQARNTKFCYNGANLSGTLHEGLSSSYCFWPHRLAITALSSSDIFIGLFG